MNTLDLITANDINKILTKKENEIINIIKDAYIEHYMGNTSLPHSSFLRFPNNKNNRIIGLPAYIKGANYELAGLKWISSFPENIYLNKERASAILVINNMTDGRVETILESSIISAKRTAASAALAAKCIHSNVNETTLGLIGCGRINYEIFSFINVVFPHIKQLYLYDISSERANRFVAQAKATNCSINITVVDTYQEIFSNTSLISLATTVSSPYIFDISMHQKNCTILNISLRDLAPEFILLCDNVVDDIDHVCREKTSIHLASQLAGNHDFVSCTLADILVY